MNSDLRFHHLGIATKSIDKCAEIYVKLGYTMSNIKSEPTQNVKIAFLTKGGNPELELIEPTLADSPISRLVNESGTTPYHICFEVDDIYEAIDELENMNFRPLFRPTRSEVMEDGLFCYLFSVEIGLVELYQRI